MGSNSSNLRSQILYYYLFHKKLELFFTGQNNPFIQNNKEGMKLENYYIIDRNLIYQWMNYSEYSMHKTYLDSIEYNCDFKDYIKKLEETIEGLNKVLKKYDIPYSFTNGLHTDCNWYSRTRLQIENFENIIDEKAFEFFKKNLNEKINSNIKGIITNDKLIIFYENFFQIKFLYHGHSINQGIEHNNSLIQLTADFSQISNGIYDKYNTQEVYNGFKKLIQSNIDFAFKLFDNKNINYSKEEIIIFSNDIGNNITVPNSFILRNDN